MQRTVPITPNYYIFEEIPELTPKCQLLRAKKMQSSWMRSFSSKVGATEDKNVVEWYMSLEVQAYVQIEVL